MQSITKLKHATSANSIIKQDVTNCLKPDVDNYKKHSISVKCVTPQSAT